MYFLALIDFYLQKSEHQNYIVQAKLKSHPSLADIANNAICCARIVTVKRPDGTIEFLSGVLKLPNNKESTNSVGLICAIESATGKLGKLYSYRAFCKGFTQHPYLHIDVQGRILPSWQKVINLAKDAHVRFPEYFSLGWDVAMTADGPLLLETNQCWDVLTMQRAHGVPLGMTAFGQLCNERIDQLNLSLSS